MTKEKKDINELLEQIKYDDGAKSVIGASIVLLLALAVAEVVFGFFMNGYSVIADGVHNLVSAAFCIVLGKKIKKVFATIMIPVSAVGLYYCFRLMILNVSYLDRAPQIWLFMIIIPVILLKIGFAISVADKIKLNGVRGLRPVSSQLNVCVMTAVASFIGLFSSFFISFYVETAIAVAIFLLSLIECFRIFGQFKEDYIKGIIEKDTVKPEVERDPDEFSPISVGEIHLLSKSMGVDATDEEIAEKETSKTTEEKPPEEKAEAFETKKKKPKKIFSDDRKDENDDW